LGPSVVDLVNVQSKPAARLAVFKQAVAAVPDDRLLLESDCDDPAAVDAHLRSICAAVAEAKGWSVAHTAAVTTANSIRFAETRRPS